MLIPNCNWDHNKAEMLVSTFLSTLFSVELKLHFVPSTPFTLYQWVTLLSLRSWRPSPEDWMICPRPPGLLRQLHRRQTLTATDGRSDTRLYFLSMSISCVQFAQLVRPSEVKVVQPIVLSSNSSQSSTNSIKRADASSLWRTSSNWTVVFQRKLVRAWTIRFLRVVIKRTVIHCTVQQIKSWKRNIGRFFFEFPSSIVQDQIQVNNETL